MNTAGLSSPRNRAGGGGRIGGDRDREVEPRPGAGGPAVTATGRWNPGLGAGGPAVSAIGA